MIDAKLFGVPRLTDTDSNVVLTEFYGIKPKLVFYLLALCGNRPVTKDRLADLLWDGDSPSSWSSTLEGYVSLLRRGLQPGVRAHGSVIITRQGGYLLDRSRVRVDLETFDDLIQRAADLPAGESLGALQAALLLADGEVIETERSAAWVTEARSRYARRVHGATIRAGRLSMLLGDGAGAIRYGERARDLDPLAEDAWALVIEGQWRNGRRIDAIRTFRELCDLLVRELGVGPSAALEGLYGAIFHDGATRLSA